MKRLVYIFRSLAVLGFLGLLFSGLMAQERQSPYVLSPWVGPTIDGYEIWRFDLFAAFEEGTESVSIYQTEENTFKVSSINAHGTANVYEVERAFVDNLTIKIEDAIPSLLFDYAQLQEMEEAGDLNVLIRLRLREAQVLSGTIAELKPMYLVLSNEAGKIRIELERIIEIEFGGLDFDTYYLGDSRQ